MILDDIVAHKREELAARTRATPLAALRDRPLYHGPRRGFRAALQARGAIIAEVKKASPSKGVIRADFDPVRIALAYAAHGAAAMSVLTDERYFQGRLDYLAMIRQAVAQPLLEKDFVVDRYQVAEARACGADAILLIVAALTAETLAELSAEAGAEGLDVLVEVHNQHELDTALRLNPALLGINNRDLHTFVTTLETTERLMHSVPSNCTVVAESGIETRADIERLLRAGAHAFLIGETLMRAPDPGRKLDELRGVARAPTRA
ncbi:MAG TPA: indole-3-glycerol phosphate synthase TrpC [Candidatus Binatia bacterium]|nr:indole-3-glycerol phosphate synthase TrpC [Candidatus Binatia bacterium]